VDVALNETRVRWACSDCQADNEIDRFGWSMGSRILEKARYEYLGRQDYSMTIVFSAMALECEVAALFFKWTAVQHDLYTPDPALVCKLTVDWNDPRVQEYLEGQLRKITEVDKRIKKITRLLDPNGIDTFVAGDAFLKGCLDMMPSLKGGSLAKAFQRSLFWPRNRILHHGYAGHDAEDAKKCFNFAQFGLEILGRMDAAAQLRIGSEPASQQ
jgi:hypothetical protein